MQPDYQKIYTDIILHKFPEKKESLKPFLSKEKFTELDIIKINQKLFGNKTETNQKYRSYSKSTILKILDYQKKNNLNNSQLAIHFQLSRNTVAKWKKMFL